MSAKPVKAPAAVPEGPAAVASVPNPAGGDGGAEKKSSINQELWQACAGPLVNLPAAGTLAYYFPQGRGEQVAALMKKDADAQIPNYPNLPSKLLCLLQNVTLHADPETDVVYARMTLQPVRSYDREALLRSDLSLKSNRPPPEFFCKTLTASDTSTLGGFSIPRRAAEKIFPPLDFSMQPPSQELMARDLHDNVWNFRHIYRGQPKRHLLTTGWSLFVSAKRLFAGDSVLFIRDEKQQLLLGVRRANRQSPNLLSSVLSSDSMHIGILAASAHAVANNSPLTLFFNPRASPSEFVIPLAKYYKAVYSNQVSLGMRFGMMFETEDLGIRRYMGTITGISDLDPVRWKNSQWRNLQVGWDESTAGERRNRVSIWEIEPVTAPFFMCAPPLFRSKSPRQLGMPDDDSIDFDNLSMKDPQALSGLSLVQWMNMQQSSSVATSMQPNYGQPLLGSIMQNLGGADLSHQFSLPAPPLAQPNNLQFGAQRMSQQAQQVDQLQKLPIQSSLNPPGSLVQSQQQFGDMTQQLRQGSAQILQPRGLFQENNYSRFGGDLNYKREDIEEMIKPLQLSRKSQCGSFQASESRLKSQRVYHISLHRSTIQKKEGDTVVCVSTGAEEDFVKCRRLETFNMKAVDLLLLLIPSRSLALNLRAECLVEVYLPSSNDALIQDLVNLKKVDLSCSSFTRMPDLSRACRLQCLDLHRCKNLVDVSSIQYLTKLEYINLKGCTSLTRLPSLMALKFLLSLDVSDCINLRRLPPSLGCLSSLAALDLRNCKRIQNLPKGILRLKSVQTLSISGCSMLMEHASCPEVMVIEHQVNPIVHSSSHASDEEVSTSYQPVDKCVSKIPSQQPEEEIISSKCNSIASKDAAEPSSTTQDLEQHREVLKGYMNMPVEVIHQANAFYDVQRTVNSLARESASLQDLMYCLEELQENVPETMARMHDARVSRGSLQVKLAHLGSSFVQAEEHYSVLAARLLVISDQEEDLDAEIERLLAMRRELLD